MKQNKLLAVTLLTVFVVYCLFPTHNSTSDSYAYAADIRYGLQLFRPHHLLYSPVMYLIVQPLSRWTGMEILAVAKLINSFISVCNLLVLYRILLGLGTTKYYANMLILWVAFSFGVWRFSVENEGYIMSIFFSLLASYFYLKGKKKYFFLLSGLCAAVACLIHQVQFFWWLGLAAGLIIYKRRLQLSVLYLFPALIIPLAYILVTIHEHGPDISLDQLLRYTFFFYYERNDIEWMSWSHYIFIPIAIIRSWIQLYPTITILLSKNPVFLTPVIFSAIALFLIIRKWIAGNGIIKKNVINKNPSFYRIHLIILVLQVLFSFYSTGNSKFLIMLPYLSVILIACMWKLEHSVLALLAFSLFLWNFFYGIFPSYAYDFNNTKQISKFIRANRDSYFLSYSNEVNEYYAYKTGVYSNSRILISFAAKKEQIDSLLRNGNIVFTELILRPNRQDRGSFLVTDLTPSVLQEYNPIFVDSMDSFYGKRYITQLTLK